MVCNRTTGPSRINDSIRQSCIVAVGLFVQKPTCDLVFVALDVLLVSYLLKAKICNLNRFEISKSLTIL